MRRQIWYPGKFIFDYTNKCENEQLKFLKKITISSVEHILMMTVGT